MGIERMERIHFKQINSDWLFRIRFKIKLFLKYFLKNRLTWIKEFRQNESKKIELGLLKNNRIQIKSIDFRLIRLSKLNKLVIKLVSFLMAPFLNSYKNVECAIIIEINEINFVFKGGIFTTTLRIDGVNESKKIE